MQPIAGEGIQNSTFATFKTLASTSAADPPSRPGRISSSKEGTSGLI